MNTRHDDLGMRRLMGRGALVALLLVVAWGGFSSRGDAQPPMSVRVLGPGSPVPMGQAFVVTIAVEGASNMGAFEFEFNFDPAVVSTTVNNIQPGPFLASTGRTSAALRLANSPNPPGAPLFGAYSYGEEPGPDGSGVLATVSMLATAPGTSPLTLTGLKVTDIHGDELTALATTGSVTVGGSTVRPFYLPLLRRNSAN